jgi:hypothetical protein
VICLKIKTKKDRIKYCEWYLRNVKPKARAREIYGYMVDNGHLGNNIYANGLSLGMLMKGKKEVFERHNVPYSASLWSLRNPYMAKIKLRKTEVVL